MDVVYNLYQGKLERWFGKDLGKKMYLFSSDWVPV